MPNFLGLNFLDQIEKKIISKIKERKYKKVEQLSPEEDIVLTSLENTEEKDAKPIEEIKPIENKVFACE